MRRIRSRLTYANVMSTIAVVIALGGVSYAVIRLPANSPRFDMVTLMSEFVVVTMFVTATPFVSVKTFVVTGIDDHRQPVFGYALD